MFASSATSIVDQKKVLLYLTAAVSDFYLPVKSQVLFGRKGAEQERGIRPSDLF